MRPESTLAAQRATLVPNNAVCVPVMFLWFTESRGISRSRLLDRSMVFCMNVAGGDGMSGLNGDVAVSTSTACEIYFDRRPKTSRKTESNDPLLLVLTTPSKAFSAAGRW